MPNDLMSVLAGAGDASVKQSAVDDACRTAGGLSLSGCSLAGSELSGLRLIELHMQDVDLRGACCRGVVFPHMVDCALDEVDAQGASLPWLEGCRLRHADLRNARLGARVSECDFSNACLRSAKFTSVPRTLGHAHRASSYASADMRFVDAAGVCFVGVSFRKATLANARLSRTELTECDMRQAYLTDANIALARLESSLLEGVSIRGAIFSSDQAAVAQVADAGGAGAASCRTIKLGPATHRLEEALNASQRYRIVWNFASSGQGRVEKVMITNRTSESGPSGYAFEFGTSEFLRMYPIQGCNSPCSILREIAADYLGWTIVAESLQLELDPRQNENEVRSLIGQALDELFADE